MSKMQVRVDREVAKKLSKLKADNPAYYGLPFNRIANILINKGIVAGQDPVKLEEACK